jgi:hypothetical protein
MKLKLLLALSLCAQSLMAQINDGGSTPKSQNLSLAESITSYETTTVARIERSSDKHELYKIGQVLPLYIDFANQRANAAQTRDGLIWRAKVSSNGAKAIGLYFKTFKLPQGATLHVYSADYKRVIGGFGAHNNIESGVFATEPLAGESLIIEYFEPHNAQFQGVLVLEGVGHLLEFERSGGRDFEDSQSCQINVNCSEGDNRREQRDAVARILVKVDADLGWCSGTMVNNTAYDCKPYFLTAMHCGLTASNTLTTTADLNQWVFYFNYQSTGCSTPFSEPTSQTLTGAVMRANSNDAGGGSGSDFLLLELNNNPPSNYGVYFAGWKNNNTAPLGGYCIHHPSGDIKKISTFGLIVTSGAWGTASNSHWEVDWVASTNGTGVTEGGSSGSAIFNSSHQLVGTLTGGASSCSNPVGGDAYGKFSYHWGSNGAANNRKLSPWLDPNNSGVSTLAGTYMPCATSVNQITQTQYNLFPNPNSSGIFSLECPKDADIFVIDALGRRLLSQQHQAGTSYIDISQQAAGVYFLQIQTTEGISSQRMLLTK